ncbi:MAG TPA: hypothetical protein VHB97_11835 [Polyangia bacterium]|jgi:hypothetical protein|nr:hypothetical protein [Polyangia bacterium]
MKIPGRVMAVSLSAPAAGCTAKLGGDVTVDGAAFAAKTCRSGQALGFNGIEIGDGAGRRLRMIANADGSATAALLPAGADKGDLLGGCAVLAMHAQHSTINNVRNLAGYATLSCDAVGHKISGRLDFENCH